MKLHSAATARWGEHPKLQQRIPTNIRHPQQRSLLSGTGVSVYVTQCLYMGNSSLAKNCHGRKTEVINSGEGWHLVETRFLATAHWKCTQQCPTVDGRLEAAAVHMCIKKVTGCGDCPSCTYWPWGDSWWSSIPKSNFCAKLHFNVLPNQIRRLS